MKKLIYENQMGFTNKKPRLIKKATKCNFLKNRFSSKKKKLLFLSKAFEITCLAQLQL